MENEKRPHGISYSFFKNDIKEYLEKKYTENARILDVGAGSGTYYNLLSDYFKIIDAVEIFWPNIVDNKLEDKYNKVYNADIVNFEYDFYDIIIFGDIIEHLSIEDADKVLKYAKDRCREMIVAVPYQYPQGEEYGNIYEIHKQDDLTPQIMYERYPYLELLYGNSEYGYYILRK